VSDLVVVGPNCSLNLSKKSVHFPKSAAASFSLVKLFAQISASPPSMYERATVIFFSSVERMTLFPLMYNCNCQRNVSYSFLLPSYLKGAATRDFEERGLCMLSVTDMFVVPGICVGVELQVRGVVGERGSSVEVVR